MTTTRSVVANIALSLDGRTTGSGGEFDMGWIVHHAMTDGARDHMIAVTSPATTVLLGRKNYEGFGGFWPAVAEDPDADPRDRAFARWLNACEKIVFSTTLREAAWSNSRVVSADPATVVHELRDHSEGDIIVLASSSIIRPLLRADEVDRLSLTLCPELSGGGARLFDEGLPESSWRLLRYTPTDSGALCLVYERVHPR